MCDGLSTINLQRMRSNFKFSGLRSSGIHPNHVPLPCLEVGWLPSYVMTGKVLKRIDVETIKKKSQDLSCGGTVQGQILVGESETGF